jgi:hypothetical protein
MALLRLAAVRQCRHAAMRAGELNAKLIWPHLGTTGFASSRGVGWW